MMRKKNLIHLWRGNTYKRRFFSFFLFVQDIHTLILLNNHNIVENIEREKWNDFYY